jgi:hypothetical protein
MSTKRKFTDSKNRTWEQVWDPRYGWLPTKPPNKTSNNARSGAPIKVLKKVETGGARKIGDPLASADAEAKLRKFGRSAKGRRLLKWFKRRDRTRGGRAIFWSGGGIETNRKKH